MAILTYFHFESAFNPESIDCDSAGFLAFPVPDGLPVYRLWRDKQWQEWFREEIPLRAGSGLQLRVQLRPSTGFPIKPVRVPRLLQK